MTTLHRWLVSVGAFLTVASAADAGGVVSFVASDATSAPHGYIDARILTDETTVPVNGALLVRLTNAAGNGPAADVDIRLVDGGRTPGTDTASDLIENIEWFCDDWDEWLYTLEGPVAVWLAPPDPGKYEIRAVVKDAGRPLDRLAEPTIERPVVPSAVDGQIIVTKTITVVDIPNDNYWAYPDMWTFLEPLNLTPYSNSFGSYYVAANNTNVQLQLFDWWSLAMPPRDEDFHLNPDTSLVEYVPDNVKEVIWSVQTGNGNPVIKRGVNRTIGGVTDYTYSFLNWPVPAKRPDGSPANISRISTFFDDNPNRPSRNDRPAITDLCEQ